MKPQDKQEDSKSERSILQLINNVNRKFVAGRQEYLMLVKRQGDKEYCTLYVTDCESKFWIKKIDQAFLESLKTSMSINTELGVFAKHFAANLRSNSSFSLDSSDIAKIEIELKIGEGLLMNCAFTVESIVALSESPRDFRVILKMFLKQLFEAKQHEIHEERRKRPPEGDQSQRAKEDKADPIYVKDVLHGMKKDATEAKPKNRSLLNPNYKKRKPVGVKFQGEL